MRKALHHWISTAARLTLGAGLLWMGAHMAHAQAPATTAPVDAAALYGTHCASCHGALRTGGMGPALNSSLNVAVLPQPHAPPPAVVLTADIPTRFTWPAANPRAPPAYA